MGRKRFERTENDDRIGTSFGKIFSKEKIEWTAGRIDCNRSVQKVEAKREG